MIISDSHKATVHENSPLHILITIEHNAMLSWQNNPGLGRNQSGYGGDHHHLHLHQTQSPPPRRRSMAIHDMLNPSDGGASRYHTSQIGSDEDGRRSRSTDSREGSRRASPSRSHQGHRRMSPMSSRSPTTRERRGFRPPYSDEEVHFIWYHRIDLGYEWSDINHAYNVQFPERKRDGFGGIQCKYYRLREAWNLPRVRQRDRSGSPVEAYGMQARTGLSYPWMRNRAGRSQ